LLRAREDDDHRHRAAAGRPNPIPDAVAPFKPFAISIRHTAPVGVPLADIPDPSQITDFNGFVSYTRIQGGGVGTNTDTGETRDLAFKADMGFNQGTFIGTDGRRHLGTFVFV
jgi:hypothetical protein